MSSHFLLETDHCKCKSSHAGKTEVRHDECFCSHVSNTDQTLDMVPNLECMKWLWMKAKSHTFKLFLLWPLLRCQQPMRKHWSWWQTKIIRKGTVIILIIHPTWLLPPPLLAKMNRNRKSSYPFPSNSFLSPPTRGPQWESLKCNVQGVPKWVPKSVIFAHPHCASGASSPDWLKASKTQCASVSIAHVQYREWHAGLRTGSRTLL